MFTARTRFVAGCIAFLCAVSDAFAQPTPTEPITNRTFRYLALPRFPEGIDGNPLGPLSVFVDTDAVIPGRGPLFDRFNGGVSTGIGLGIPFGPVRETPTGATINWNANVGYRYQWLDGRNDVQLNQPGGKDFNFNHANFHLCEFGIERTLVIPTAIFSPMRPSPYAGTLAPLQPTISVSFGVCGRLGGANADVSQTKFDPAKTQIIIPGAPRDSAFAGGYEVYGKLGLQFRNGIDISVYAGYGQLFTGLLQNQSSANGYVPIGVTLTLPLDLRSYLGTRTGIPLATLAERIGYNPRNRWYVEPD